MATIKAVAEQRIHQKWRVVERVKGAEEEGLKRLKAPKHAS